MVGDLSENLISCLQTYTRPRLSARIEITTEIERHTFLVLLTLIILHYLTKERALLGGQRLGHGSFPQHSKYAGAPKMVGSARLRYGASSTREAKIQELNDRLTSSVNTFSMLILGPQMAACRQLGCSKTLPTILHLWVEAYYADDLSEFLSSPV